MILHNKMAKHILIDVEQFFLNENWWEKLNPLLVIQNNTKVNMLRL